MEQQEKLSFLGSGPKIALWTLPSLLVSLVLTWTFPQIFKISILPYGVHLWIGWILLACGLAFYGATVRNLLKGVKANILITSGTFGLCRNPLYASLILFLIPAISFLLASWLVFIVSIVAYIAFKKNIYFEDEQLSRLFGEKYKIYKAKTNEFFPFPR